MDENKMFDMLEKIYVEVQSHGKRLDTIENEAKNTSVKLESVEIKIQTLSEIEKSYIDQNDKQHMELIIPMKESTEVIELAVKNTSRDIQDLRDKFDKAEKVTIQNTYDVAYLKSIKE